MLHKRTIKLSPLPPKADPSRRRHRLTDPSKLADEHSTHLRSIQSQLDEDVARVGADLARGLGRADAHVASAAARCETRAADHEAARLPVIRAREAWEAARARHLEAAEEPETAIARRLGHHPYRAILLGLAVADVVVLSSVFQVLGEGVWMTRLLALVFALALELVAGFIGAELNRYHHNSGPVPGHRWFAPLVAGGVVVIVLGVVAASVARRGFLELSLAALGLAIPLWAIVCLQVPILGGALVAGYLHANPYLDDLDHWAGVQRRAERRLGRVRRRLARAVVRHARAWQARRAYIDGQLRVVEAHRAHAERRALTWLADNGHETMAPTSHVFVGAQEPDWLAQLSSDHRRRNEPQLLAAGATSGTDGSEAPKLGPA